MRGALTSARELARPGAHHGARRTSGEQVEPCERILEPAARQSRVSAERALSTLPIDEDVRSPRRAGEGEGRDSTRGVPPGARPRVAPCTDPAREHALACERRLEQRCPWGRLCAPMPPRAHARRAPFLRALTRAARSQRRFEPSELARAALSYLEPTRASTRHRRLPSGCTLRTQPVS